MFFQIYIPDIPFLLQYNITVDIFNMTQTRFADNIQSLSVLKCWTNHFLETYFRQTNL